MAKANEDPEVAKLREEQKRFKEDQKKEKKEQKNRKKEAKKKAKELADEEARIMDDEGGGFPVFITTVFIILVWVAILCALIKLDVGGFGSGVLAPVLKNVPVVNKILPDTSVASDNDVDVSGYDSLKDAVTEVNDLKAQVDSLNEANERKDQQIAQQAEEIERLRTFEEKQVEFERIKTEFYNEVVYSDKGPGAEEYAKYYEKMDPATAETLYKQVIIREQEDAQIKDYAKAYSEMKPKEAAEIFEQMTDNLELVAKILRQMEADERGKILGVMDEEVAAKLTKIMDPD
ncbi:MAG: hypothetical protein K6G69_05040 [Lachnospiraceae bacterium]|nr:hypothetical protein [Lachnospiraceae bacterium]